MVKIQLPETLGTNGTLGLFAEACGGIHNPRLHATMEMALDEEILIGLPMALTIKQLGFFAKEVAHFEDWVVSTFKREPRVTIV